MNTRQLKRSKGMSLIEVMIAITVLAVVMVGSLVYRYYTALDEKEAVEQTDAARIATMLCESWRGVKGDEDYDPVDHLSPELRIISVTGTNAPDPKGGFDLLGRYKVSLEDKKYHVTLAWKDLKTGLRALRIVANRKYFQHHEANMGGKGTYWKGNIDRDQFKLTTYVATN